MEHIYRLNIFNKNLQNIQAHNQRKDKTYEMGVNQFTDLTEEEFAAIHLTLIPRT